MADGPSNGVGATGYSFGAAPFLGPHRKIHRKWMTSFIGEKKKKSKMMKKIKTVCNLKARKAFPGRILKSEVIRSKDSVTNFLNCYGRKVIINDTRQPRRKHLQYT